MSDIDIIHQQILFNQVRVKTPKAGGSGTVIYSKVAPDSTWHSFALTCHHVIESALEIKTEWDPKVGRDRKKEYRQIVSVEFFDWGNVPHGHRPLTYSADAEIVAYDKAHDIALLKLRTIKAAQAVATMLPAGAEKDLRVGSPVFAVGCALLHDPILTAGMITHMGDEIEFRDYWMSSASIIFGNCLEGSSQITMGNGSIKAIRDVQSGDVVWSAGHDGNLSKHTVEAMIPAGKKNIYRLHTRTRTVRASENHPLLVIRNARTWAGSNVNWLEWVPLRDLKDGDLIATLPGLEDRYRPDGIRFADHIPQDADPADLMRLLGFYLGDGWLRHEDGYRYEVSLAIYNDEKRQIYENILNRLWGLKPQSHNRDVLIVSSKHLIESIEALGFQGKSTEKTIPDWVMTCPHDLQLAFLSGYLESDGHVNATGSWVFEANNEGLVRRLRMLCIHLGFQVSNLFSRTREESVIAGRVARPSGPSVSFQVYPQYSHRRNSHFLGSREHIPDGLVYERVRSIYPESETETYDLKIEGSHNFFADGVLVHNSGGAVFAPFQDGYAFIGIPSRVDVIGWENPIVHLNYFSPIPRIYKFLDEQRHHYLIPGHTHTEEDCSAERAKAQETEDRRLQLEAPEK